MRLRAAARDDRDRILDLNNDAVPAVSELTPGRLAALDEMAFACTVAEVDEVVEAFVLVLDGPGRAYESQNYRWLSSHFDHFLYVDRIVVDPDHHGTGIGRALYEWVIASGTGQFPVLTAEVNIRPHNEQSLVFHDRFGFVPVGESDTEAGAKRVRYLALDLDLDLGS